MLRPTRPTRTRSIAFPSKNLPIPGRRCERPLAWVRPGNLAHPDRPKEKSKIYDSADAFKAHLETVHFKKYAETTKDMVKSRKRIDNVPITLNVKGK
jgi:hypothetical protein